MDAYRSKSSGERQLRKLSIILLPLALLATSAEAAKAVKVIEPFAAGVVGGVSVESTTVTISDTAGPVAEKLEAKAAEKRAAAHLPPVDATATARPRPEPAAYETLPLAMMFPLAVEDVTRDRGLTSGRRIRLAITIDTIKTANAGMMMLLGSSDELAGTVQVLDAADGTKLGEFYVDVLNVRAGMLGAAMRGSGVREKLAAEFAKHVAEQLSGSKRKPKAKQP